MYYHVANDKSYWLNGSRVLFKAVCIPVYNITLCIGGKLNIECSKNISCQYIIHFYIQESTSFCYPD